MNNTLLFSILLCVGLVVSSAATAQAGDCNLRGQKANNADCKAMIRAEVKKEIEKLGLAAKGAADCTDVAKRPYKPGAAQTRQQLTSKSRAAAHEVDQDELDECPQ
ncbi:MAG: hypothetical protein AB8C46_05005 [Burkholderiaceae bacterium]